MKTNILIFLLFITTVLGNMVQLRKSILDKVLRGYDVTLRPNVIGNVDSPTEVAVNLYISDIFDVNDFKMDYTLQTYLREVWFDPRLRFPDPEGIVKSIPVPISSRIWTPDLFFNEREGKFHNIQKSNRFAKIYSNGRVSFNSRLTLKLHCPMDFKYFPFDRQVCTFELESYGYETRDMSLKWSGGNPIQVNSKLHMPNFILEDFKSGFCTKASTYGHGCLTVKLQLKRHYGYFLTQIFVPFVILVGVSWLSLWLDAEAVSLRLPLITILLFLMTMLALDVQHLLPPTPYSKAIDIWIAVCLSLVFGTLLQFFLVNQLSVRERKTNGEANQAVGNGDCEGASGKRRTAWTSATQQIPLSKKIDFLCRVLFPVAFVIFNCVFWFTFIKRRDNRLLIT